MTTVLVAEDDDGVRLLLVTALERKGYAVVAVGDGRAAMDLLDEGTHAFDVVISDVNMPGARGLDVLAHARTKRPGIGLILASATDRWELPREEVAQDVTLLEKPYGLGRLIEAVEAALQRERGRQARQPD